MSEDANLPRHIGFIVDGNRRWAKQHGLPTYEDIWRAITR